MPLIENANPEEVRTPLQPLFPKLVTAFLNLSPHSRAEAERILAQRQIRFELDSSSNEFLYAAAAIQTAGGPVHQRFCVGLKAIERTWAAIFGYGILFCWTAQRFNANLQSQAMPEPPEALGSAIQALKWAFSDRHETELLPWPNGVPSPSTPHSDSELMRSTNAAAVRAIGWILLHELGHFDRGHFDSAQASVVPDAHQQEFEADDWAARTVTQPMELEHCRSNLCAIPFSLGVIAGVNWRATNDHPAMSARLLRIYRNHIVPKTIGNGSFFNAALFAVMTPLQALLYIRGISPDQLKVANDLDDFLPWWEAKMVELGG